jgi:DNA mismatch repair protein MutS
MLDTNTFKGEASFFSITGRVLAAYELMKQVKDELAPVFAAAGELDMYVALAQLYNEHEDKNARYCMVDFIENSTTPVIKAENFWNPFIDADKVVVNTMAFDLSCPNSILTGPNTGGKSTVIKAIMLDVLMAQTFGIAPAKSLSMTPFTKLNCFMNISDDIATGASLFKSEVMRAKKLLDLVQSLKQDEFSFVIIDEVFTGTSPQEGEQAALQFAKKLGSYTNNISIIATHYPKMVDLEKETKGNYRNHHVEILRNEDGSLNRTFKLKNGPTFMNVAFDILEEEGLFV